MKNKLNFLVMLISFLVLGSLFISCNGSDDLIYEYEYTPVGTITISGTPKVGEKLTAISTNNTSGGYFINDFIWVYADSASPESWPLYFGGGISGACDSELIIPVEFLGKFIKAVRSHSSMGVVGSNTLGPVVP